MTAQTCVDALVAKWHYKIIRIFQQSFVSVANKTNVHQVILFKAIKFFFRGGGPNRTQ